MQICIDCHGAKNGIPFNKIPFHTLENNLCYAVVVSADFFAYFFLKRSTRPAVSRSFCFPVKKGWHLLQISTLRLPTVERVSKVFPQMHETIDFMYVGWMSFFIENLRFGVI